MAKAAKEVKRFRATEQEKVFLELIDLLHAHCATRYMIKQVAEEAEVHYTTLYNWMRGEVMSPRLNGLIRVAAALGYQIVLKKPRGSKPRLRSVR